MDYKTEIKKNLLKEYKALKRRFFKNQFSHSKVITLKFEKKKYMVIIDPGFGLTILLKDDDIKILKYLLNKDFYDFGIAFSYYFIGDIMTFQDNDYKLNVYRKRIDSYFEEPSLRELSDLSSVIDALYPTLKYYNDNLTTVEQNVEFVISFDDDNQKVSINAYSFPNYSFYHWKFKTNNQIKEIPDDKSLVLIDMFTIELPIFSTDRKKLINPYILTLYCENTHSRRFYLIPYEKKEAYEKAIEILNANVIGCKLCITNALLYQAISCINNSHYDITFEPLQYYRVSEIYTIEYNFYNEYASKDHFFVDYDILASFFDNLNKCYEFIDDNFDGEDYDESLFKSLNPKMYDFFIKFVVTQDENFIFFESCLLNNQLFGNLYPYRELIDSDDEDDKETNNENEDFEITENALAS